MRDTHWSLRNFSRCKGVVPTTKLAYKTIYMQFSNATIQITQHTVLLIVTILVIHHCKYACNAVIA